MHFDAKCFVLGQKMDHVPMSKEISKCQISRKTIEIRHFYSRNHTISGKPNTTSKQMKQKSKKKTIYHKMKKKKKTNKHDNIKTRTKSKAKLTKHLKYVIF